MLPTYQSASILHGQQSSIQATFPDPGIPPSPVVTDLQRDASVLVHPRGIDQSCPFADSRIDLAFPMAESISEVEPEDRSLQLSGLDASPTCPLEVQRIPESISGVGQPQDMTISGEVPEGKLTSATLPQQDGPSDDRQAESRSQQAVAESERPSEPPFRLNEEYRSYDAPAPTGESSVTTQPQGESSTPEVAEASDAPRLVDPPDEAVAPSPSEKMEKPIEPIVPVAPPAELQPSVPSPAIAEPIMDTTPKMVAPTDEEPTSPSSLLVCAPPDQGSPPSPNMRPVLRNRPASTILQKMRRLWERCTSGNLQTEGEIPTLDRLPSIQNIHRLPMPWHYQLPASKIASLPWVEYPLSDRWHLTLPASLPSYRPSISLNDPQSLVQGSDLPQQSPTNELWIQTAKQIGQWLGTQVLRPRQWDRAETAQWLFYLWR
jgi:hypothetical protein